MAEDRGHTLSMILIAFVVVAAVVILVVLLATQYSPMNLLPNSAYQTLKTEYNNSLSEISQLKGKISNLTHSLNNSEVALSAKTSNVVFSGTFNIQPYTTTLNETLIPGSYNISFSAPSAGYLVFNLTLTPAPNITGPRVFYISSRKFYLELLGRWLFATSAANTTGFSVIYQNASSRYIVSSFTVINQTPFYKIYPILNETSKIEFYTLSANTSTVSGTITYYGYH